MSELKPILNALLRAKTGALLLILQIAVTLAVVSNSAYIIYERVSFMNQPTGLDASAMFKFNLYTFGKDVDIARQQEIDEQLLRSLPGVVDAVVINQVPLSGSGDSTHFSLVPPDQKGRAARAAYFHADDHLANTLGVEIVEGRDFNAADVVQGTERVDFDSSVAVVTNALANELFPEGDALGKVVYFGDKPLTIVGIFKHMKGPWLDDEQADNVLLVPLVRAVPFRRFLIRTEPGRRAEVMKQVESVLLNANGDRVVSQIVGLDELVADQTSQDRLMTNMLEVLITVLVSVTALGIGGLALFNVERRTRQIGTRRALGARKRDIVSYFLMENSLVALTGIVFGALLAHALSRVLMEHYSLPKLDPWFVVYTLGGIYLASVLAVYWPAHRASQISPSIATRSV